MQASKSRVEDQRLCNLEKLFRMIEEDSTFGDFVPARTMEESRNPLQEWAEAAAKDRGGNP